MTTSHKEVGELLERARGVFAPKLKWKTQFQTPRPQKGDRLMHYAFSDAGTFEIYEGESGTDFLLSFPKRLRRPAELLHALESAKQHAELALSSKEPS